MQTQSEPTVLRIMPYLGGEYNAAIARIAIAASLWMTLSAEAGSWSYVVASVGHNWIPKGLVKLLFPLSAPSAGQVESLILVAKFSCVCMALGIFTRISQVVCALSVTLVVSLYWSFYPYWSHGSNVQLLTALIFMFCRSGDRLSVDYLVRKFVFGWNGNLRRYEGTYWLPLLAAELAVHLFMFAAFYSKWTNGDGIWWALSENLRNSIAVTWGLYRFDPPAVVLVLLASPLLYKTVGLLQLFTQATNISAVGLIHWPVLRIIVGGGFFLMEILGLTHIFEFWHPFWVPLCMLSVDWEWLWYQARNRFPAFREGRNVETERRPLGVLGALLAPSAALGRILFARREFLKTDNPSTYRIIIDWREPAIRLGASAYYLAFIGYYVTSFVFQLGETQLNYPFSSMAFYSENRDYPPFGTAKPWPMYRGWIDISDDEEKGWLKFNYLPTDQTEQLRLLAASEGTMEEIHSRMRARFIGSNWSFSDSDRRIERIAMMRTHTQIVAVPAYPEPALPMQILHSGLLSVEDAKGFRGVSPQLVWDAAADVYKLNISTWGFKEPQLEVWVRWNVREEPKRTEPEVLPGTWRDGVFFVRNTRATNGRFAYSLIKVTDRALGVEEIYAGPENFQTYR